MTNTLPKALGLAANVALMLAAIANDQTGIVLMHAAMCGLFSWALLHR